MIQSFINYIKIILEIFKEFFITENEFIEMDLIFNDTLYLEWD